MNFSDLAGIIKRRLPADQAEMLCQAICDEAAGERVYIPARPEKPEDLVLPTDTPARVQARHQVTRRTAYRWCERWR